MKMIRFIDEYWKGNCYYFKGVGSVAIVDEYRAKMFCRKGIDWPLYEKTGKWQIKNIGAEIIRDMGLHFGQSKHIYKKGRNSQVFGRNRVAPDFAL